MDDFHDVFRCLDASTGTDIWTVRRLAIGALDYGNSPRATPLIHNQYVYCLGALGVLLCIDIETGEVVWERNLSEEFRPAADLPWGYCGSPLLVDGKLIVAPGATEASVIALNPDDGRVIWKSTGAAPGYGSLIAAELGGRRQIIGHDAVSFGGWDVRTGERIWTLNPAVPGDFNVPTPVVVNDAVLIATENNGTRLHEFSDDGRIRDKPLASYSRLRPDMSTCVVVHDHAFCVNKFLYCLSLKNGLSEAWRIRDPAISEYGAIIASRQRILVVGNGELLLLPASGEKRIASRLRVFDDRLPVYSHPAIVGDRLFIRGESRIACLRL